MIADDWQKAPKPPPAGLAGRGVPPGQVKEKADELERSCTWTKSPVAKLVAAHNDASSQNVLGLPVVTDWTIPIVVKVPPLTVTMTGSGTSGGADYVVLLDGIGPAAPARERSVDSVNVPPIHHDS